VQAAIIRGSRLYELKTGGVAPQLHFVALRNEGVRHGQCRVFDAAHSADNLLQVIRETEVEGVHDDYFPNNLGLGLTHFNRFLRKSFSV
jgi:hypothetical protein